MKIKRLWLLLPFAGLFFMFFLGFEVIPFAAQPFAYWWDMPAAMSLAAMFIISLGIGIKNGI